jgi:hypothetical protein
MPYDPEQRRLAVQSFMIAEELQPKAWCRASGLSETALWPFLNRKTDSMGDDTYEALADGASKLKGRVVTAGMIRGEPPPFAEVPVAGYVGAGAEIHPIESDDSPMDYTDAPPGYAGGRCYVVRGDSMSPVYEDADRLYVKLREDPPRARLARPVVVQVKDGPLLVKKLLPGTRKGLFHLLSVNPMMPTLEDRPIEWIERIGWVNLPGGG